MSAQAGRSCVQSCIHELKKIICHSGFIVSVGFIISSYHKSHCIILSSSDTKNACCVKVTLDYTAGLQSHCTVLQLISALLHCRLHIFAISGVL